jgi:hypothetical protein
MRSIANHCRLSRMIQANFLCAQRAWTGTSWARRCAAFEGRPRMGQRIVESVPACINSDHSMQSRAIN